MRVRLPRDGMTDDEIDTEIKGDSKQRQGRKGGEHDVDLHTGVGVQHQVAKTGA